MYIVQCTHTHFLCNFGLDNTEACQENMSAKDIGPALIQDKSGRMKTLCRPCTFLNQSIKRDGRHRHRNGFRGIFLQFIKGVEYRDSNATVNFIFVLLKFLLPGVASLYVLIDCSLHKGD
jgi:hypothetical protein